MVIHVFVCEEDSVLQSSARVPRRECHVSVRATRHTVDSAIDPVCPLGPARPLFVYTLCMARHTACCVLAKVCLWCVYVCDYCVMYIHSIHSSGSLTLFCAK